MKSTEQCRLLSVECRQKAQDARNEYLRQSFNEAAEMWLKLMIESAAGDTLREQKSADGCAGGGRRRGSR